VLDPHNGRLCYASAGHPPAFLYRRGADAIGALDSTGTVLGVMPGEEWVSLTLKWAPGDALLLYTDGITEARPAGTEDLFEAERVRQVFFRHRKDPPDRILSNVFSAVQAYSGGALHDDCAMLLVSHPFPASG
jgi:serine phosphatase RsbU (regulator of sigma subunit)